MDGTASKPIDIYARVSVVDTKRARKDRSREPSTEGQVAVCHVRLADLGLEEGKVLVEPGRSAWNPAVKRPAWDELMDRLESGVSGGFIVFDLERWTRQPKDAERMIELAGRGLLVLDSESEYDLTTPNGKKSFRDAINAAAYYSDRLSTRSRRGKKLRAMSGEPNSGGNRRPFGFEADQVTQRKDEAAELRDAAARFLAGEVQASIIDDWNKRGITTSTGQQWTSSSFKKIMIRERNCGRIIHTDAATGAVSVVGRIAGEPIIQEEDFDQIVAKYAARRLGRPVSYLCSGLAICGLCRNKLMGRPVAAMRPYDDGSVRREYWCSLKEKEGCGKVYVDQRALDEAAEALTIEILSDDRHADAIEATSRELESEAARLDLAIADAESVAEALSERLGRGEMTLSRYDIAIRPLNERLAKLGAERDALGDTTSERPERASREHWQRRWTNADMEERRRLLKMALRDQRIVVARHEPGTRAHEADATSRIAIEPESGPSKV